MVKVGVRRRSFKKSFTAKTKGNATRSIKRALIPGYGKRGAGWAHPQRKLYNKVYSKTTIDSRKLLKSTNRRRGTSMNGNSSRMGCGTFIGGVIVIALLMKYWYIVIPIVLIVLGIWYYNYKNNQAAAAVQAELESQKAEELRQQQINGSKVDQIRDYKKLLDEGAITQEEFDQQKKRILGNDDDLMF